MLIRYAEILYISIFSIHERIYTHLAKRSNKKAEYSGSEGYKRRDQSTIHIHRNTHECIGARLLNEASDNRKKADPAHRYYPIENTFSS